MSQRLRHTTAFLAECPTKLGLSAWLVSDAIKGLLTVGLIVFAFVWLLQHVGCFMVVLFVGGGQTLLESIFGAFRRAERSARMRKQGPLRTQAWEALLSMQELAKNDSLARRMDPDVADALESCAAEYASVTQALATDSWRSRSKGSPWATARTAAQRGAREAMEDAVLAALPGVRLKGVGRKTFAETMASERIRQSIFEPLAQIKAKLHELAVEVGGASLEGSGTVASIDQALRHLRDIRVAEAELDEPGRLTIGDGS